MIFFPIKFCAFEIIICVKPQKMLKKFPHPVEVFSHESVQEIHKGTIPDTCIIEVESVIPYTELLRAR